MITQQNKIYRLEELGFHVGFRFPYVLPQVPGKFMVYDLRGDEHTDDDYCDIGYNLEELVDRAYEKFFGE